MEKKKVNTKRIMLSTAAAIAILNSREQYGSSYIIKRKG